MMRRPPRSTLFPDTTLCRSQRRGRGRGRRLAGAVGGRGVLGERAAVGRRVDAVRAGGALLAGGGAHAGQAATGVVPVDRSEEHTSESSHANISYAVFCLKKK